MLALSIVFFSQLSFAWWWYPAFILVPDVSMIGYAFGNRIGAYSYNFAHHKGIAIIVGLLGYYIQSEGLELAGIILFAHASMDRIFGYGLKYPDSFQHTHLGILKNMK